MTSTFIFIDIRAENKTEIMDCICDTIEFMPGWSLSSEIKSVWFNIDERMLAFNLTTHRFEYWRSNESYSDTMDADEMVINNLEDISRLLEFVYLNADRLKVDTEFIEDNPCSEIPLSGKLGNCKSLKEMISEMEYSSTDDDENQMVFNTAMLEKLKAMAKEGKVQFVTTAEQKAPTQTMPMSAWDAHVANVQYHYNKSYINEFIGEPSAANAMKLEKAFKAETAKIYANTKVNPDF